MKRLLRDIYVDDVATSFCTMEEGLVCVCVFFLIEKMVEEGDFELLKWNSKNKELIDKICVEENESS